MEAAWRFRIMLIMAFAVIIFGDFLGYGGAAKSDTNKDRNDKDSAMPKSERHNFNLNDEDDDARMFNSMEEQAPIKSTAASAKTRSHAKQNQHITDIENSLGFDDLTSIKLSKEKLTEALRDACLPKLLCEMAAKPNYSLNDRERELLSLIKSTTLSLAMQVAPTRWHFAAHMGQLLRHPGDEIGAPIGCSQLFVKCPYSSQKLLSLSGRIKLK